MAERTKGTLFIDPNFKVAIRDTKLRRVAAAMDLNTAEDDANAAHLVACWNAVEATGGDPAIVAEALESLRVLLGRQSCGHTGSARICDACGEARRTAKALLRRAGSLS